MAGLGNYQDNKQTQVSTTNINKMNLTLTSKAPRGYLGELIVKITDNGGYFSVTGEISTKQERRYRNFQVAGCIHDLILKSFPQLEPLVKLHLAESETGEPLHALENSFYWLAGALGGLQQKYHGGNSMPPKNPEECFDFFCKTLRISHEEGERVTDKILGVSHADFLPNKGKITKTGAQVKKELKAYVTSLKDRWQNEAKEARSFVLSLQVAPPTNTPPKQKAPRLSVGLS